MSCADLLFGLISRPRALHLYVHGFALAADAT